MFKFAQLLPGENVQNIRNLAMFVQKAFHLRNIEIYSNCYMFIY